jgi:transcriptional regulator with XRE-family HTH domain
MARARDELLIGAFAAVLRQARTEAGLSQEELALRADINRTFVGLLEGGKRQPTLSVIFALAREVNLAPEVLVLEVRKLAAERAEQT